MDTTKEEKKRLVRKLTKKMLASIPLAIYDKVTSGGMGYARASVIIKDEKYNLSASEIENAIDTFVRWFGIYKIKPAKVETRTKKTLLKKAQLRIITFYI